MLLTPYKKTSQYGPNFFDPPSNLMDSFKEYEVKKIIKHKRTPQSMKYLIRWKGYSPSNNTWEWEDDLKYSGELLREYKTTNQLPQNNAETHFKLIKRKYCSQKS
ncbi:hypothetical protein AN958_05813 [Leucoagaricus sp. SymC.cos]|nr:hypothetical protein AN958_05813 [Leucoagaricus sp. SymC.cos]